MKKNPGKICGRFRTAQPSSTTLKHAAIVTASLDVNACVQGVSPDVTPHQAVIDKSLNLTNAEIEAITARIVTGQSAAPPQKNETDASNFLMGLVSH